MKTKFLYILSLLFILILILCGNVSTNDFSVDLSSPEDLYKTLVQAVKTKNIDLLWQCTDSRHRKTLGDTKDEQLHYLSVNFKTQTDVLRNAKFNRVEYSKTGKYFDAIIWMVEERDGKDIPSSIFCRKEDGVWKTTVLTVGPVHTEIIVQKSELPMDSPLARFQNILVYDYSDTAPNLQIEE